MAEGLWELIVFIGGMLFSFLITAYKHNREEEKEDKRYRREQEKEKKEFKREKLEEMYKLLSKIRYNENSYFDEIVVKYTYMRFNEGDFGMVYFMEYEELKLYINLYHSKFEEKYDELMDQRKKVVDAVFDLKEKYLSYEREDKDVLDGEKKFTDEYQDHLDELKRLIEEFQVEIAEYTKEYI